MLELDVEAFRKDLAQALEVALRGAVLAGAHGLRHDSPRAAGEADDAVRVLAHEVEREARFLLLAGQLPAADQAAEARPTGVVLREEHEVIAVDELELRAEHGVETALLCVLPEPHGAVEPVRVREREGLEAELECAIDQVLGM